MTSIPINFDEIKEISGFLPKFIDILSKNSGDGSLDILSLFENYTRAKEISQKMRDEGIVVPNVLIFSPSMQCNLDCIGCYAKGYPKDSELSLEEIDRIITEAKDLGIFLFLISGGEPLFKEGLLDVLTSHRDVVSWIFTNGTLFTESVADSLEKCRTIFPLFSIEGFKRETDTWRGKGVYDKVISAMESARRRNIQFGFSTTVTKRNISPVTQEEFIDGMIEAGCKVGIYLDYNHKDNNIPDTFSCDRAEKLFLKAAVDKYNEREDFALINQSHWEEMAGGCLGAGRGLLHINSQGDVEPCPMVRLPGGNIRDKSLKDILGSEIIVKMSQNKEFEGDGFHQCILKNQEGLIS